MIRDGSIMKQKSPIVNQCLPWSNDLFRGGTIVNYTSDILLHVFQTVKSFLPNMLRKNHGHIVTMGSSTGLVGLNKLTDYSTSKYGVVGFSEVLAYEVIYGGYDGVHTTLVCPSFVNTGLFKGCEMR